MDKTIGSATIHIIEDKIQVMSNDFKDSVVMEVHPAHSGEDVLRILKGCIDFVNYKEGVHETYS